MRLDRAFDLPWELEPGAVLGLALAGGLYARGVWRLWRGAGVRTGVGRWEVDAASRQVVATIPVGERTWGLSLSADGTKLYAANGVSNDVSVIDTGTGRVVSSIRVGDGPWGIAARP